MKKSFILLVSLAFVFTFSFALVSCTKTDYSADVVESLTVPFEFEAHTDNFAFTFSKTANGAEATLISPDTLSGLVLEKTPSGITASYDGLVVTLPTSASKTIFAIDDAIEEVKNGISNGEYTSSLDGDTYTVTVSDGKTAYSVKYGITAKKITEICSVCGEEKSIFTIK